TDDEKLSIGINLKYFYIKYFEDEYTKSLFSKYSSKITGTNFDIGLKLTIYKFNFGIVSKNIYPLNIGLVKEETMPQEFNFAFLWKISPISLMTEIKTRSGSNKVDLSAGAEFDIIKPIAFRAGVSSSEITSGLGINCKLYNSIIEFNYTVVLPYKLVEIATTHRLELIFHF
ncbi:MAG: hypothetical protein QME68_04405, partial [Elusimicrobiota bacterium]|nr:hypothetical protein [Elusimicrobiota bacterium]